MRLRVAMAVLPFLAMSAIAEEVRLPDDGALTADERLAQQLNNPLANLISVPFNNNIDHGGGRGGEGMRYSLVAQPVIPFRLNEDWNLITRTIVPYVQLERVLPERESGLGDVVGNFWFSPAQPTDWGLTWGVGPAVLAPTGTNRVISTGQWGVGPTGVAVVTRGPWTTLLLGNYIWSAGGAPEDRDRVSQGFVQAALAYTLPSRTTLFVSTESIYEANSRQWTVPLQAGLNQLLRIGDQPIQLGGLVRSYVDKPTGGPDWGFQLRLTFVFQR